MIRWIPLYCCLFFSTSLAANTIVVKNSDELQKANREAKPGDVIILQNGEWNNVTLSLTCTGTKEQPITFKAQSPGKVLITGNSRLKIGGSYIIADGLYFINGYAGNDPVFSFRADKNQLSTNCRITNCVINDFNNLKRLDENNWVLFYGKNNRLDHCSFLNKKNLGVLLAVILDDDRSRENFHSIDHNYFGLRLPLASNGGEIIRVGVSQHCEFNSNTQITDNVFEHCDGEAEVVSIKSGSNVVRNNLFRECQGSVVLRHGNFNTVENNVFIGNDKEGTGGVRVINKGQWVINNFFYKCRGTGFRCPLTVMNGIPNSPAFRYVQVTDAVIANNTFFNCSPVSFCEGSDTERTLPPANAWLINNTFYNTRDNNIYRAFDDISGFVFAGNSISKEMKQTTAGGFARTSFTTQKADFIPLPFPSSVTTHSLSDSLQAAARHRLQHAISASPGFADLQLLKRIMANGSACGAPWFAEDKTKKTTITLSCKTTSELRSALNNKNADNIIINLTSSRYDLTDPLPITKNTEIIAANKQKISFRWPEGEGTPSGHNMFFLVKGGCAFKLTGLQLDFSGYDRAFRDFIRTDTSGSSQHANVIIRGCTFSNMRTSGGNFFCANKSVVCDSIIINGNTFRNNDCNLFEFTDETDRKGYYNVEKLLICNNTIDQHAGAVLQMVRGGNDESTLGPKLYFFSNKLNACRKSNNENMISLTGTQWSAFYDNEFTGCYAGATLVKYEDFVRAEHFFSRNTVKNSGNIITNKYVLSTDNIVQ